jgi:chromosome segregation ATPase
MLNAGNILAIVALVGLLITAATVIGGSFRVSRNTQTVSNYREAALSWESQSKALEAQVRLFEEQLAEREVHARTMESQFEAQLAEKDARIHELEGRLTTLQDVVTGKAAVEALTVEMRSVVQAVDTVKGHVDQVHLDLAAIRETLSGGNHHET